MGNKELKILFQEPFLPRSITYGKFESGAGSNTFPYGISCIASYIKKAGYEVSYIDLSIERMPIEDYLGFIKKHDFKVVGIGSTTLQINYVFENFKIIKEYFPHIITVMGGVHATLMPNETMTTSEHIDYLILGEGEKPFLTLLDCLKKNDINEIKNINGICFKEHDKVILNPPDKKAFLKENEIPPPLFDIFPMKKYIAQITYAKNFPSYSIIASRGCPYLCTFCNASDVLGKKVRYKQADKLIEEIGILKHQYGAKGIMFLDSTFTVNKRWVMKFCERYIESGLNLPWACNTRTDRVDKDLLEFMKDAGCWTMLYGIESANQKSLNLIKKNVTVQQNTEAIKLSLELGYYVYTSYILCLPGESEEDVLNTIEYARKMGNHLSMFYLPVPFPKTGLSLTAKETGGLREDAAWEDYNAWSFENPVYINPLIGKKKMKQLLKRAFVRFYSNPIVLYRNIKEFLMLKQSPYKFWLGTKGLAGYLRSFSD